MNASSSINSSNHSSRKIPLASSPRRSLSPLPNHNQSMKLPTHNQSQSQTQGLSSMRRSLHESTATTITTTTTTKASVNRSGLIRRSRSYGQKELSKALLQVPRSRSNSNSSNGNGNGNGNGNPFILPSSNAISGSPLTRRHFTPKPFFPPTCTSTSTSTCSTAMSMAANTSYWQQQSPKQGEHFQNSCPSFSNSFSSSSSSSSYTDSNNNSLDLMGLPVLMDVDRHAKNNKGCNRYFHRMICWVMAGVAVALCVWTNCNYKSENSTATATATGTATPSTMAKPTRQEPTLRTFAAQYRAHVTALLLQDDITTPERLEDTSSPAHAALQWLVDTTTASNSLTTSDHDIITRFALATLYFATTPAKWKQHDHWLDTTTKHDNDVDVCQWHGVECAHFQRSQHEMTQVVTQLSLPHNNLQGTLPRELFAGLQDDLILLDLSHNHLHGVLPNTLGGVGKSALRTVKLQDNALSGDIPTFLLSDTKEWKVLALDNNNFSSTGR